MKTTAKRLMSLLMCIIMLISLMPAALVSADYSDGQECPGCGHYHWDDYMCDECGYCSTNCGADCWLNSHCNNCGKCLADETDACDECSFCFDCMMEHGHCVDCYDCYIGNSDGLCGNCYRCEGCTGPICTYCGFCEDCRNDDDSMHCPECGSCYQITDQCADMTSNHCIECCNLCEQCGKCMFDAEDQICEYCGLCSECCEDNSASAGGSGDICIESTEWDDHVCSDCGEFFEDGELCDSCFSAGVIRCTSCCESASDCSMGMCENSSDYEEHFCEECGSCFDDVTQCSTCLDEKVFRCEDCCTQASEIEYGCDDGFCQFSDGFSEHVKDKHSGYTNKHSAAPSNRWSIDANNHYRACRYCSDASHVSEKAAHTYDKNGVCTVCAYKNGATTYITRQPTDAKCKVSDPFAGPEDRYYPANNMAKFSISVKSDRDVYYYWHVVVEQPDGTTNEYAGDEWEYLAAEEEHGGTYDGFDTPVFTVTVPYYACHWNYYVYCNVYDYDTSELLLRSDRAKINADHLYTRAHTSYIDNGWHDKFGGKQFDYKMSDGHKMCCVGCFYDTDLDDTQWASRSGVVSHHFEAPRFVFSDSNNKYRVSKCTDCGFEQYTWVHDHKYRNGSTVSIDYDKTEKIGSVGHVLNCLVYGCTQTIIEAHDWGWKIVGWPSISQDGAMRRECKFCGYSEDCVYVIDESGNKVPLDWNMNNALVDAKGAEASKTIVKSGDKLTLTINHALSSTPQKCTGWEVYYQAASGEPRQNISDYYRERKTIGGKTNIVSLIRTGDGGTTWWVTKVKLPVGVTGGGKLIFEPNMTDCTGHSDTIVVNKKDPVCSIDGYTGDTVCRACGTIVANGYDIPATGQHRKSAAPIEGTARPGGCNTRAYSGNYKCLDCGKTVRGETGNYYHKDTITLGMKAPNCHDGYTGDVVCIKCKKLVRKGVVLKASHKAALDEATVIAATCTTQGYSGDTVCTSCGELVKRGKATAKLGHKWAEQRLASSSTTTVYKCARAGCNAMKFENKAADAYAILVEGGTAYAGAKAVTSAKDGVKLTLKALVPEGKTFKEWEVVSGGVTIANATSADGASIVMPKEKVHISAVFVDKADPGPGHEHKYTDTVTAPTCTAKGYTTHTCACGDKYVDSYTDALGHSFKDGKCLRCGASESGDKPPVSISFTDVAKGSYYEKAVLWAVENGITKGTSDTTFSPDDTCTRAQAVTFLWRAAGSPEPKSTNMPFTDVKSGAFYYKAVLWAVENGITKGTSDTTFSPDDTCSRGQIVTFLWRAQKSPSVTAENPFVDVKADAFYTNAVLWAVNGNITNGTSKTTFAPNDNCTRGQIVTFIYRAMVK